ncbi:MAG: triose-phosphate isomerase [Alphaproteobacteria bacterium]|nr:triose-phosphate isomerase [Alphaproteobacteria bacterium]
MSSPRVLIAGNWKMNGRLSEATALAQAVAKGAKAGGAELLVCPPFPVLASVKGVLSSAPVALGAQDCHAKVSGAHTGDVAAEMLRDVGCAYVIVGHSERRTDHEETDGQVRAKAEAALRAGLKPIVCVGETLAQRDAAQTLGVVADQIAHSIPETATAATVVIAYEPVWAIGTGRTPTVEQVAEVHAKIRADLEARFADGAAFRILYGGSVKGSNAAELLAIDNVDGALIGGASLKADEFLAIAAAAPDRT